MKITFQPTESPEIGNHNEGKQKSVKDVGRSPSYGAVFGTDSNRNMIVGAKPMMEKGKTLTELQQEAGNVDVAIQQDYRTVMSHTMSEEDYAKMEKEGFHFAQMDPETAVTIVDKIKAELARSGQYIAGYTDDLDMKTLAAALGSEGLAGAVADSFREADIPLTQENIDAVKRAWEMTSNLHEPSEGSCRYMVDNEMEPEIWDYYLAQSSGAQTAGTGQDTSSRQPRFYAEDIQGYYAESANRDTGTELREEIDKVLVREGFAVNEENRRTAALLLEEGLPLTGENMARMQRIRDVEFPVTEERFAHAAASAIAEGKDPIHGNLAQTGNIYERAAELLSYYRNGIEKEIALEDITSRRQLEEIRLRMSAEVNVKLLKSGFAIDTAPMEQLVEALRKAEAEVAEKYFPGDTDAVAKYEAYRTTNEIVGEIPTLPAQTVGHWDVVGDAGTLAEFHAEGKALQESYEKAQTSYETLMTAPRKDLGDSIRKAFANVDDILKDLGLDITEENQRAVRILGYNRMTIHAENIERVKAAEAQVKNIVSKMTPAATLKMIRDGVNPLEKSFAELEQYFDRLPEEYEDAAESYSRFLYGLEQNKAISQQERDAYIGIYRMLHQIDASDGAAVGTLVNTGAEIHFSNLLSAVRSGKFKSLDVSVTESFGATVELIRKGESISDQIAKGFVDDTNKILTDMSYSEEAETLYRQEELQQIREAASVSAESVEMLLRGQVSPSAENLLAAQALSENSGNPFQEWKLKKTQMSDSGEPKEASKVQTAEKDVENIIDNLPERLDNKEDFKTGYQELIESIDQQVQEMSLQQADNSVNVRELRFLHLQLSVAGNLAKQEEYIFPMYIGEELTKVHLTLDRGGEEKGTVQVAVDLSDEEHLEAHFQAADGEIEGFLVGNTESAVTKLQTIADIFSASVPNGTEGDWKVTQLPVADRQENVAGSHRKQTSVNREVPDREENTTEIDNTELYRIAKVFLEAVKQEREFRVSHESEMR